MTADQLAEQFLTNKISINTVISLRLAHKLSEQGVLTALKLLALELQESDARLGALLEQIRMDKRVDLPDDLDRAVREIINNG